MKTILTAALALIINLSYAQTDCKPYIPSSKGAKWEVTNYSPKGKETGKTAYELLDKVETGSSITFSVKAVSYDKKGKETFVSNYDALCVDGKFELDMAFMIDGEAMQAYQGMDIDLDASEFEIPSLDAAAGTALKDGTLELKVGSAGVTMFRMTILVYDRKVDAREDRTTPAGTFNCLKLSQHVTTKMMIKIEASTVEWYAEEVGLVRSESYNKNGKLTGYTELTKLKKP